MSGSPASPAASLPAGAGADRRDIALLFATRILRMFGYGFLAVVLVLYLAAIGLSGAETASCSG